MLLSSRFLWKLLIAILSLRLLTLGLYPLMDTSEARYGEMARKMVELQDWITPMYDYGVPFWGKPPLSFWSQAAAIQLFGVNEFAVRFPAWLFHVLSCVLIIRLGREVKDEQTGLLAAVIYSSTALGLVASGVVLTDPALGFSILLAFYGFWRGMLDGDRFWARMGFVGLGLGLLAKGPLVLVLFGLSALAWTAFNQRWLELIKLPWVSGLAIMLVVAVPWYVIAEIKTPGFLDYFLVGEHWKRYVISKWSGDLYGSAHAQPLGTIWLNLFQALLPWVFFLPMIWFYQKSQKSQSISGWQSYLWCWALSAPLFFTMAGNILWTYVLPALPAWALLLSQGIRESRRSFPLLVAGVSLLVPGLLFAVIIEGSFMDRSRNQMPVVKYWENVSQQKKGELYYLKRFYSADFYSAGKVKKLDIESGINQQNAFYLAVPEDKCQQTMKEEFSECSLSATLSRTDLWFCPASESQTAYLSKDGEDKSI